MMAPPVTMVLVPSGGSPLEGRERDMTQAWHPRGPWGHPGQTPARAVLPFTPVGLPTIRWRSDARNANTHAPLVAAYVRFLFKDAQTAR